MKSFAKNFKQIKMFLKLSKDHHVCVCACVWVCVFSYSRGRPKGSDRSAFKHVPHLSCFVISIFIFHTKRSESGIDLIAINQFLLAALSRRQWYIPMRLCCLCLCISMSMSMSICLFVHVSLLYLNFFGCIPPLSPSLSTIDALGSSSITPPPPSLLPPGTSWQQLDNQNTTAIPCST